MDIFIDIETVPAGEKPRLEDLRPPGNISKAETIQKWYDDIEARTEDLENIYRKRALSYLQGRVLCIAWAVGKAPVEGLANDDEEQLFKDFEAALGKHDGVYRSTPTYIAHNGQSFDYPFLYLRACKYGCRELAATLMPPNHREFLQDTMKIFVHTDYKGMVSLKNACEFFGIDAGKDDLDGSKVYDEYLAGNTEKILKYCMNDVENVRKLYKIFKTEV